MGVAHPPKEVLSHWYHLIDDFHTSSLDFYTSVERHVEAKQLPETTRGRVDWREGRIGGAKREYLRVTRGRHVFDICAAPFGTGFFISWWLVEPRPALHPLFALLLFAPFMCVVSSLVMAALHYGLWTTIFGLLCTGVAIAGLMLFLRHMGVFTETFLLEIPVVGWLYDRIMYPDTYFKIDSALMFQEHVRRAVQAALEEVTQGKAVRLPTKEEQMPIMRALR